MNKKTISVFGIILLLASSAHATLVYPVDPSVVATIKDKNGKKYQFRETYDIDHGAGSYVYDFGRDGKYKEIYSGDTYSEDETCPPENSDTQFDNAIIEHNYIKKDVNGDGLNDITLNIVEENCKTGEKTKFIKQILSTSNGFEIKTSQHKE